MHWHFLVSDDDDDEDEDDVMDEQTAKDFAGFIAEPGDEVNYEILSSVLSMCLRFVGGRRECQ